MMSEVRKAFKLVDEPDVVQYISELGREVLKVAGPQFFDYQFFVIDDKEFNAFAAPSGLIFMHSGLIDHMDNEDELVGVLAHECAHVANRHIADRIDKATKVNIGTVALVLAGIAMGGGPMSEAVIAGGLATGASMNLKFSRANEEEADRMAFTWMTAMGRDPWAMLSMLSKMRRISILKMGKVPPYLLTHPDPAMRMGYVQDLLSSSGIIETDRGRKDFSFHRIRYRILSTIKSPAEIMPRLRQQIRQGKDPSFMAHYGLALGSLEEGNFSSAEKYLQEVIDHYPDKPVLLADLAVIFSRQGNHAKALSLLEEARKADRDDAFTGYHLARTLEQEGKIDRAIELYEELLRRIPAFGRLHYHLSQNYATRGLLGKSHYHTGVLSFLEGNTENAKYHLNEAIKKLPADDPLKVKAREMLGNVEKLEKL
ncbi:MAG: M48 family metalloprotease [Proteobacteria bacterium]|nr:M48 family metalloprotease [Pseudomonadota bacterium]MBU1738704.1 M48 family metalloprotease [Pseudomonadota bacterium]